MTEALSKHKPGSPVTSPKSPPLLITAAMEVGAFKQFDALRQQYFPPERNHLPAHITLFHKLPLHAETIIIEAMRNSLTGLARLDVDVTGVARFGQGVGYVLTSPALSGVRQSLSEHFRPWLSPQDAQSWRPHITVQNKVAQKVADRTFDTLSSEFSPSKFSVTGLLLWEYLGGPWKLIAEEKA